MGNLTLSFAYLALVIPRRNLVEHIFSSDTHTVNLAEANGAEHRMSILATQSNKRGLLPRLRACSPLLNHLYIFAVQVSLAGLEMHR